MVLTFNPDGSLAVVKPERLGLTPTLEQQDLVNFLLALDDNPGVL